MIAPTRAQVKVLKTLQNQTVFLNAMVAEATQAQQQSGQRPPPSWFEDYHHRAVVREELTNAAHAGGVPRAWIDHVRERGDRGLTWRADLYLRTPAALDWDPILGTLTTDAQRLCEWSALEVAYGPIGPATDPGVAFDFDRNLAALRARTAGIANLLGLTAEQGHELWGATSDWAQAGVAMLDGVPVDGLVQRWRAAAHTDIGAYGLQAAALASAGITIDSAAALPPPEELASAIGAMYVPPHTLFRSAATTGHDINAAIGAANLTYSADAAGRTGIEPAVFSDAASADPWFSDTTADIDIPAPEFLPPVQEIER
ncbi:hypothetical protein [Nocardia nepalensis]|uniref:hypothetical protein n=1 Tax=Nocardia nepalensis TaxID=3375448 RepID=UPI003B677A82